MSNINTTYLGLSLKSPLIISSSGLTNSVDKIRKFEELGAGAVVLKSLFEEQINFEAGTLVEDGLSPEAHDYITNYSKANALEQYLLLIENAKKSVKMPVIASINCMSASEWVSFARDIEKAGADALELNIFFLASNAGMSSEKTESLYYEIIQKVKLVTRIPVAVKIGSQFTNIVDLEKMEMTSSGVFSSPADIRNSLRWTAIISDKVEKIDVAASTGIHDSKAAIKQLLAGAKAVQACSVFYEKGIDQVKVINESIASWMDKKGLKNIEEFRGSLSYSNIENPAVYERSQFMKYFSAYQ